MTSKKSRYLSFLLRLWMADDDENPVRRVSLESSLTGEFKGFANLDDLFNYLKVLNKGESEDANNESG